MTEIITKTPPSDRQVFEMYNRLIQNNRDPNNIARVVKTITTRFNFDSELDVLKILGRVPLKNLYGGSDSIIYTIFDPTVNSTLCVFGPDTNITIDMKHNMKSLVRIGTTKLNKSYEEMRMSKYLFEYPKKENYRLLQKEMKSIMNKYKYIPFTFFPELLFDLYAVYIEKALISLYTPIYNIELDLIPKDKLSAYITSLDECFIKIKPSEIINSTFQQLSFYSIEDMNHAWAEKHKLDRKRIKWRKENEKKRDEFAQS